MINQLDEAELRVEMRRMVRDMGIEGSWQCLYEILFSAKVLLEIMQEEGTLQ